MRSLTVGAAIAIALTPSVGVKAADLAYPPPPPVGHYQYGLAPPPGAPPPQVMPVPRPGAPVLPPIVGVSPYGAAPSVPADAACPPVWRCVDRACGWQPSCPSRPEPYSGPYEPPGPQVYRRGEASLPQDRYYPPQPYSGPGADPYARDQSPYRP
jgi:hypothetical protein